MLAFAIEGAAHGCEGLGERKNVARDKQIGAIDASNLFPPSVTSIVISKKRRLPKLVQDFLQLVVPNKWNGRSDTP